MNTPLVSILICTYNAKSTIVDTINSCLNQTYQNIEILIHDDQSTDNTINLIKDLNNSTIHIIDSWKKLWPYWGLNYLLEHAQWDYIAIQDHDDLWNDTKIEKQIEFLESNKWERFVGCGTKTRMSYESDNKYFDYYIGHQSSYTLHPSLIFRNKWQKYPKDKIYMNDAYFQKVILCKWDEKIYNIDETLVIHRIKSWAENLSYKWFKFTKTNVQTIFELHPRWYAISALIREGMRKICYPFLQKLWKWYLIDRVERVPFQLQGYQIKHQNGPILQ